MSKVDFTPDLQMVSEFNGICSIDEIAEEQAVFSASPAYITGHYPENSLTQRILSSWNWNDKYLLRAKSTGRHLVIDTRVQRLMPGMYPSIPGWHCDGVPRASYDSQPDFDNVDSGCRHYVGLIATSHHVSNTEFVSEPMSVEFDNSGDAVYKQVHRAVGDQNPETQVIRPGQLWRFDQTTIHRTLPTAERGWRLFFRLSIYHKPPLNKPGGHQQVYLLSEENGW